ncbi:hypothetical protein E3V55_02105 [Candidatus Marinimicrobia bacterium MT.SAG.3]|nr:hypothetical protein E3V55_02105 [Candidatus Marinimicrobia bacterium MT.SAG.3]
MNSIKEIFEFSLPNLGTFELIISLIDVLIWPVVVLIVLARYKNYLLPLLKNIKKAQFFGQEVEYYRDKELQQRTSTIQLVEVDSHPPTTPDAESEEVREGIVGEDEEAKGDIIITQAHATMFLGTLSDIGKMFFYYCFKAFKTQKPIKIEDFLNIYKSPQRYADPYLYGLMIAASAADFINFKQSDDIFNIIAFNEEAESQMGYIMEYLIDKHTKDGEGSKTKQIIKEIDEHFE